MNCLDIFDTNSNQIPNIIQIKDRKTIKCARDWANGLIVFGTIIRRDVISKYQIKFKINSIVLGFFIGFTDSLDSIKTYD